MHLRPLDPPSVRALTLVAVLLVAVAVILSLSSSRAHFGYGTETDTLGGFIPEAQRFLDGAPLDLLYHPPLYSMILGAVYAIFRDWLWSGLVISGVAAVAVVLAQHDLWRRISGHSVAFAAVATMLCSPPFLIYSSLATSDVLFFALYSLALMLAVRAMQRQSVYRWVVTGVIVGLAVLTRSNGIVLLLLAISPVLVSDTWRQAGRAVAGCAAGIAAPLVAWWTYAFLTASQIWPDGTHNNLAMTYFGDGDRISGESMRSVAGRFQGLTDVLVHDPAHLTMRYVQDLAALATQHVYGLFAFPFSALVFCGALFAVAKWHRHPAALVVLLVSLAHVLLLNLKTFEPRFFLFLLPLVGAGIGIFARTIATMAVDPRHANWVWASVMVALVVPGGYLAASQAAGRLTANDQELAQAVGAVRRNLQSGDLLLVRKPHLGFYTQARTEWLPDLEHLSALRARICSTFAAKEFYLYYGEIEQKLRPQFREDLMVSRNGPDWLTLVDRSDPEGGWALFRIDDCSSARTS